MKRIVGILILALAFGMSGCVVNVSSGRNFNHHAKKQTSVSSSMQPGQKLNTNLTHMDLIVTGQETDTCTVITEISVSATSQEIADTVLEQITVEIVEGPDGVSIALNKPQEYKDDYCVSGRLTITVPSETALEMVTTHGDCSVENISETIYIKSTHGDFTFSNILGDIIAASTHGDINISNSQNRTTDITTSHGRILLSQCNSTSLSCKTSHNTVILKSVIADQMDIETSHGQIELNTCSAGQAHLNTTHGAIKGDIAEVNQITALTTHAPIHLQCVSEVCPDFSATLNTTHNNIEFCPPSAFAGQIHASTTHGKIHSEIPIGIMVQGTIGDGNIDGTIGQGDGSITLNTTHGNITLKNPI